MTTTTATTHYGTAVAQAWDRLHPRLTHRSAWIGHDGPLPVIEGTLIRLQVDHLPAPKLRDPQAADRWTWLIIIAHTQLRLARPACMVIMAEFIATHRDPRTLALAHRSDRNSLREQSPALIG